MEPQPVPPLSAFQGHSNEEASQAGLGARRARDLRRPRRIKTRAEPQ